MPYKDPGNHSWFAATLISIMTLLGTAASCAYKMLNGEKISWGFFFLQVIVSIFAGAMLFLASSYYNWEPELAGGIAGLSGWSGAELIKTLEKRLLRKVSDE
ncbi:TPA: phage holin family protein [Morganella morganii]